MRRPGGGVAPEVGGRAGTGTAGLGAPAPQQPGPPEQAEAANSLCPRSWARAPRRACGCAARTCCCRCLRAQVSLRRFAAACPARLRPLCLSSPTRHLGLARCPCRKGALRFSGWSLEQEAGLPRRASLCCPWDGGTQSCHSGLQGLRGRALGGEVLLSSQENAHAGNHGNALSLEVPAHPCPESVLLLAGPPTPPLPWLGVPGEPPASPTRRHQLGRLPGSPRDRPSGEHSLRPEPRRLPD